ncbi:MAG TPA: 2-amino-4-hydroxy-6-hydroxymethyldihydropteridine diphosphokinase [Massilibacterium sp.]|nr:2-amino-4-hydroxy-6-hydroxymethyldihydropteridine diphosphokinase [Massilibacterium sp.]
MNKAYLALGSNVGDRYYYLKQALQKVSATEEIEMTRMSSIYETDPVGYENQDCFLNMVIEVKTTFSPHDLLLYLQRVERELGRKRDVRFGPRTLDLDILLYEEEKIETDSLQIPHPRMTERAFVLIPLKEINKDIVIPREHRSLTQLIEEAEDKLGVRLFKKIETEAIVH